MKTRCKPGDLAICEHPHPLFHGVIVTIKRAVSGAEVAEPLPGMVHWEGAPALRHPEDPDAEIAWPDAWMRPIRGGGIGDEVAEAARVGEVAHA